MAASEGIAHHEPSGSIIAVAAIQLLGSCVILFVYGQFLRGWIKFIHQYPVNHQALDPAVWVAFVAVPISFSLAGVITSIGLFRLREWARRSTILLSLPVLSGAVLAFLHPLSLFPPDFPAYGAIVRTKSSIVLVVFLCLLALLTPISLWWLIAMTRASVRSQFRQIAPANTKSGDRNG